MSAVLVSASSLVRRRLLSIRLLDVFKCGGVTREKVSYFQVKCLNVTEGEITPAVLTSE